MPKYLHINFQIWFPISNFKNLKYIKNGEIHSLRTPESSVQQKSLRFEAKNPYYFDRNKKKEEHYLKRNSQTPQEKTAKIQMCCSVERDCSTYHKIENIFHEKKINFEAILLQN